MKLILLRTGAEVYPKGEFYPAQEDRGPDALPKVPEVLRPRAYERVLLEAPFSVSVSNPRAKAIPLGEGEFAWTAELARQYGGKREEYRARHHPTRLGAFVAGVKEEFLREAFSLLKPGGWIYPLPLALAWLAASRRTSNLAFFVREGYGLVAVVQGGEVVDIVEFRDAAPSMAWLTRAVAEQSRLLGNAPEEVLLVDTRLREGKEPQGAKPLSLLDAPLPKEIGWGTVAREGPRLLPLVGTFAAAFLLAFLPSLPLRAASARLEARKAALEAEIEALKAQVRAKEALERRKALLENIVRASAPSPIEEFLGILAEELPQDVLVASLGYDGSGGRMEVYSANLASLLVVPKRLSGNKGGSVVLNDLRRSENGWRASLTFSLQGGGP
jgi:hypothetical protein